VSYESLRDLAAGGTRPIQFQCDPSGLGISGGMMPMQSICPLKSDCLTQWSSNRIARSVRLCGMLLAKEEHAIFFSRCLHFDRIEAVTCDDNAWLEAN
jgi:hypothetical protein